MKQEKTRSVFERVTKVMAFIQPQRSASYYLKASEKDINFEAASALCFILENAARSLRSLPEAMDINPIGAINNTNTFQYAVEVDALLFRLERWMSGKQTAAELVLNTHAYCKDRVMDGYLANLNSTSPLDNLLNVYRYQTYCTIVKTIDNTILRVNEARDKETAEAIKNA